ncbi:hypothetical protein QYE76_053620 [Lolium multiflorum]|uniref:Integrase catalytic domain-containing protein n=1 Tax=Lolium multiflorum TaxID=4521 RepID=A0AAD8SW49_LOLMU|nr:hypothetical protein QYE76_053620 [Lolium multiflorum]
MPIPLSWPFAQWGLDMVGKLHKASPGGYEYMLVAVDKFTKWIEAKPINSPDAASAIKFVKSIVFRFGVPHSIVTDNDSNFTSKEFKAYCAEVGIKLHFASVGLPQTNGQVEKANGIICNVDVLLAVSNQSNGAFDANLQAFLAKFEPKIFLRVEALGESCENLGLLFLWEEIRKKTRQTCSGFSKAFACFLSMKFKKRKLVKKLITFGTFQVKILMRFPYKEAKERSSKLARG